VLRKRQTSLVNETRQNGQREALAQTKLAPKARAKSGGGGIRTRVRKYIPAGIYDAYLLLNCRSRREEAAKNRRKPAPENLIADVRDARRQPAYLNDIYSRPAG
jgi:hypothetical protein